MRSTITLSVQGVLVAVALLAGACGDGGGTDDPAATIEAFIAEYNAGDLDGVAAIFAEDAVMVGHPFQLRATGRDAIRSVHAEEVGGPGKYAISNVETSGDTVTWDHVWAGDDNGSVFEFCVQGHSATVVDGHITSWTWPDTTFDCEQ